MASCVLRRAVIPGLRKLNTLKKHAQLKQVSERLICSSTRLLQKYYTTDHEYIDVPEGQDIGTVGITDYAQDKLGDVVYIQLPEVGDSLEAGGEAGVLESVKAASDILSPVSGEVTEVNEPLPDNPELINKDPYGDGWLYKMKISDPGELGDLMSEEGYDEHVKAQE